MKVVEGCRCSASFEAEGDNEDRVEAALATWRARHNCDGHNPWRGTADSTVAAHVELGFNAEPVDQGGYYEEDGRKQTKKQAARALLERRAAAGHPGAMLIVEGSDADGNAGYGGRGE